MIIHKATIKVDEKGTVATAATAIAMPGNAGGSWDTPPVIKFDHPFVFRVNDGLFIGVINNPNLKN